MITEMFMDLSPVIYNVLEDELNVDLFDYMQENEIPDISYLLSNDPDMLNIDNHRIPFVELETSRNKWVIYLNMEPDIPRYMIDQLLLSFFSYDFTEKFERRISLWSEFNNHCIAYRGGIGSTYSIWRYIDDGKETV